MEYIQEMKSILRSISVMSWTLNKLQWFGIRYSKKFILLQGGQGLAIKMQGKHQRKWPNVSLQTGFKQAKWVCYWLIILSCQLMSWTVSFSCAKVNNKKTKATLELLLMDSPSLLQLSLSRNPSLLLAAFDMKISFGKIKPSRNSYLWIRWTFIKSENHGIFGYTCLYSGFQ